MQLNIFDTENTSFHNTANRSGLNSIATSEKIPGLKYVTNFITVEEHRQLWQAINSESWLGDLKRRVQHYGWKYDYKARSIDYSMYLGELPVWAKLIADKIVNLGYLSKAPDQVIVNEYLPGQGIANHIDCEPCFGETIISVSLGSDCVMDFINVRTKVKYELMLEKGSLIAISKEARHSWSHGIPARKTDYFKGMKFERSLRISLTFRNVIINTCAVK